MMFAGHHTTQGTAAWTLLELLRHPDYMAEVVAELDDISPTREKASPLTVLPPCGRSSLEASLMRRCACIRR